jgi:hypothetical protein
VVGGPGEHSGWSIGLGKIDLRRLDACIVHNSIPYQRSYCCDAEVEQPESYCDERGIVIVGGLESKDDEALGFMPSSKRL